MDAQDGDAIDDSTHTTETEVMAGEPRSVGRVKGTASWEVAGEVGVPEGGGGRRGKREGTQKRATTQAPLPFSSLSPTPGALGAPMIVTAADGAEQTAPPIPFEATTMQE